MVLALPISIRNLRTHLPGLRVEKQQQVLELTTTSQQELIRSASDVISGKPVHFAENVLIKASYLALRNYRRDCFVDLEGGCSIIQVKSGSDFLDLFFVRHKKAVT